MVSQPGWYPAAPASTVSRAACLTSCLQGVDEAPSSRHRQRRSPHLLMRAQCGRVSPLSCLIRSRMGYRTRRHVHQMRAAALRKGTSKRRPLCATRIGEGTASTNSPNRPHTAFHHRGRVARTTPCSVVPHRALRAGTTVCATQRGNTAEYHEVGQGVATAAGTHPRKTAAHRSASSVLCLEAPTGRGMAQRQLLYARLSQSERREAPQIRK